MLNVIHIEGRLTSEPELRYTKTGQAVTSLFIASSRRFKDRENVVFVEVQVWGDQAEWATQYLKKGWPVQVHGRLDMQQWETDGQRRSKIFVVADKLDFIDWAGPSKQTQEDGETAEPAKPVKEAKPKKETKTTKTKPEPEPEPQSEPEDNSNDEDDDDDIPF